MPKLLLNSCDRHTCSLQPPASSRPLFCASAADRLFTRAATGSSGKRIAGGVCNDWYVFYCVLQVATAIRGAIIQAKMSLVPVRRGYWGNKIGKVHTVPIKVTGKCGSVLIRLVPAPRGAGIVAARVPKKVLQMAGIEDCYTSSRGSRKTLGNFVKATFNALSNTYSFLTPDLWRQTQYTKSPLQVGWV